MNAKPCSSLIACCSSNQTTEACLEGAPCRDGDVIICILSVEMRRLHERTFGGGPIDYDAFRQVADRAVTAIARLWPTMTAYGLRSAYFIIAVLRAVRLDREPLTRAVLETLLRLNLPNGDAYGLHDDLWEDAVWQLPLSETIIEELQQAFWHRLIRDIENGAEDYAILAAFAFNCLLRRPTHRLVIEAVASIVQAVDQKRAFQKRIIEILTRGAVTAPEVGVSSLLFLTAIERCLTIGIRDGLLDPDDAAQDLEGLRRLINRQS